MPQLTWKNDMVAGSAYQTTLFGQIRYAVQQVGKGMWYYGRVDQIGEGSPVSSEEEAKHAVEVELGLVKVDTDPAS